MPKVYLFDVDETLEGFAGPVTLTSVLEIKRQGHVTGICGNWGSLCRAVPNWHEIFSLVANLETPKDYGMFHFRRNVPIYEDYVLVGNILGVSGVSDDQGAAQRAGWRFIKETDFAAGVR